MIELNISDIPEMSGKKPGDMVSLNIDVEVKEITDDVVSLKLVSAKEIPLEESKLEGKTKPVSDMPKKGIRVEKEVSIKALKPEEA
jgi:hypothetical protein